jgi:coenzyme F420-reducing hydrogenase gamma subunit
VVSCGATTSAVSVTHADAPFDVQEGKSKAHVQLVRDAVVAEDNRDVLIEVQEKVKMLTPIGARASLGCVPLLESSGAALRQGEANPRQASRYRGT